MAKWKKGLFSLSMIALIITILITSLSPIAYAQKPNHTIITTPYDFPIKPGTDQWKAFTTHDEMVKACQVPDLILSKMTTTALVETVLNYPLLGDVMAYNDMRQGFNAVASRFNGLSELIQRNDAGTALLAKYKEMNPTTVLDGSTTDSQKYTALLSLIYIEAILAQDSIKSELTDAQLQDLATEAAEKSQDKQQIDEYYSDISQEATSLLISTTAPQYTLLREYTGYVYTPRGSAVQVIFDRTDYSFWQRLIMNKWVDDTYPNATRLSDVSKRYNCHSYAWHSTSTSNNAWMNSPNQYTYWTDGSYSRNEPYNWGIYRARWISDDHSGQYWYISPGQFYQSKWGELAIMQHSRYYCPYDSTTIWHYQ